MAARTFDALDQEQRIARAFQQSGDYLWTQRGDEWLCEGPHGVYVVTETSCTCDDWRYRCANAGAVCKHMYLRGRLLLELGGPPAPPEEAVCQRCGVVEPVAALVALDDIGTYACRECYEGDTMTAREKIEDGLAQARDAERAILQSWEDREEDVRAWHANVYAAEVAAAKRGVAERAAQVTPEERAPSRKPMTEREQSAFDRIFG